MNKTILQITPQFIERITKTFGMEGAAWLDRLPLMLSEYADRWSLRVSEPYSNLSYNYITRALCDNGTEVVLKAGVPRSELCTEIEALTLYDGKGCVRLLKSDSETGILLLEQLNPGNTLTSMANEANDEKATSIAAKVMRELWKPVPAEHEFPSVNDWAEGMQRMRSYFGGGAGPFPVRLVEEAETLFSELLGSMHDLVVLHGDLHHDNILYAEDREWLAFFRKEFLVNQRTKPAR